MQCLVSISRTLIQLRFPFALRTLCNTPIYTYIYTPSTYVYYVYVRYNPIYVCTTYTYKSNLNNKPTMIMSIYINKLFSLSIINYVPPIDIDHTLLLLNFIQFLTSFSFLFARRLKQLSFINLPFSYTFIRLPILLYTFITLLEPIFPLKR